MLRAHRGSWRLVTVLALALWGCDSPTASGPRPGLTIRTERGWTDTVLAAPTAVAAEVRDLRGNPVHGATVTFRYGSGTEGVFYLSAVATQQPSWRLVDTTDASGRGEARLWHGGAAGDAWLRVEVALRTEPSTIAFTDSVAVRTTPGQPARLIITPSDTALYQGNSGVFRAIVTDRTGNHRPERAEVEAGTPGIAVSGSTVQATTGPSRQVVRARFNTLVDSVWLSIVPKGTIVVRYMGLTQPDYSSVFATLQLDGSEYRRVLRRGGPSYFGSNDKFMSPQWGHTGDYLLFFDGSWNKELYRTTLDGVASPLFSARVTEDDTWQQVASDGSWVYFDGATPGAYRTSIYRARLDGSEATRISQGPERFYQNDLYPSPSPDGRYVVYATDRETGDIFNLRLQVLEVETGVIRSLGVAGTGPRWSPRGDWIAFSQADSLYVVRPDGTGLRRVSGYGYEPWASWSPDGRWIVAERFGPFVDVIEVETGLTLPLGFTGYLTTPAWRP